MKKTFQAKIDEIRECLQWLLTQVQGVGFSPKELNQIELATEEVMVNIISHSLNGKGEIELEVRVELSRVEIIFSDQGAPFNPLNQTSFNPNINLEEREIGGLGIHFIKKCMDEVKYERKANSNVLTLLKTNHSSQIK